MTAGFDRRRDGWCDRATAGWLSGRNHDVVYVFDTINAALLQAIPVDGGPHGLAVWPQPGRFSLGHTGNMR